MKLKKPFALIFSIAISFVAAGLGTLATTPNIPTWYAALEKPFFNPPNWIFGPVWTVLYLLMGIALYLVIIAAYHSSKQKRDAYTIFGVQLVLNVLWSVTFFGLHLPETAIAIIVLLLISIIVTIIKFWPFSKLAAKLLIPYVLWVGFATALNIAVAALN